MKTWVQNFEKFTFQNSRGKLTFLTILYDKIKAYGKPDKLWRRFNRSPLTDQFQRGVDSINLANESHWRDVHFQPDTHIVTKSWWEFFHFLDKVYPPEIVDKLVSYRNRYVRAWHGTGSKHATAVFNNNSALESIGSSCKKTGEEV